MKNTGMNQSSQKIYSNGAEILNRYSEVWLLLSILENVQNADFDDYQRDEVDEINTDSCININLAKQLKLGESALCM